jgi:copper chaperone CopZ
MEHLHSHAQFTEEDVVIAVAVEKAAQLEADAPKGKPSAKKTEYEDVTMDDQRIVKFPGKRKLIKTVEIDEEAQNVTVRFDFRNGATRSYTPRDELLLRLAGHGASQKIGDETADAKLTTIDDMVLAVDDLIARLNACEWSAPREAGDSMAGASVVIRAFVEAVPGMTVEKAKAFFDKKLADAKVKGEKLTRQDLYSSLRRRGSKTGEIIARIEAEKESRAGNADDLLAEAEAAA